VKSKQMFAVLMLFAMGVLSACGQSASNPGTGASTGANLAGNGGAASKEPIKFGVLQPLTGPVSGAGQAISDSIKIAKDEINAAGGVNGRPIELVVEDTQNDPAACSAAAEKIITRDKVVAIIGAWGSSCTLAVAPVVGKQKVPMLVETSSSAKVTTQGQGWNEYIFRLSPPTPMEGEAVRGHVKELGIDKAFFLAVNNDWGRGTKDAYGPVLVSEGAKILGDVYFKDDETNFQPLLTKANASGADTILITTDAAQIALILEQARSLGMKQKFLTTGGSNFPDKVISLAKDAAIGHLATVFYVAAQDPSASANPEKAKAFNQKWTETGHAWGEIGEGARGYDAMYTLAEAAKIAKSIDTEGMRVALTQVKLKGIMYGNISFGDWTNGQFSFKQQNTPSIYVVKVKGEKSADVIAKWPK
jgi:branched-chain amino acid transport system substrate-binding protein